MSSIRKRFVSQIHAGKRKESMAENNQHAPEKPAPKVAYYDDGCAVYAVVGTWGFEATLRFFHRAENARGEKVADVPTPTTCRADASMHSKHSASKSCAGNHRVLATA